MNDRQVVLDSIRSCGRRGEEREARRIWLLNDAGVSFRAYRIAYDEGRREARIARRKREARRMVRVAPAHRL